MNIVIDADFEEFLRRNKYDEIVLFLGKSKCIQVFSAQEYLAKKDELEGLIAGLDKGEALLSSIQRTEWEHYPVNLKELDFKRIPVPERLKQICEIDTDVSIVCLPKRIEIYAKGNYVRKDNSLAIFSAVLLS